MLIIQYGVYTPTQISEKVNDILDTNLSAIKINEILIKLEYQVKIEKNYFLTDEGKNYGDVIEDIIYEHEGIQKKRLCVRWKLDMVNEIVKFLENNN